MACEKFMPFQVTQLSNAITTALEGAVAPVQVNVTVLQQESDSAQRRRRQTPTLKHPQKLTIITACWAGPQLALIGHLKFSQ